MPTENRRVATYLPKEIDDRLEAFKTERGLKGDSQALLLILSDFFQIDRELPAGDSTLRSRVEALEDKFSELRSELLSELKSKLASLFNSSRVEAGLLSDSQSSLPIEPESELLPIELKAESNELANDNDKDELSEGVTEDELSGQLNLIESTEKHDSTSELPSELPSSILDTWLTTKECWEHLGQPGSYNKFRKLSSESLYELYGVEADPSRKLKPDGTSKYHAQWLKLPNAGELLSAKTINQVSPLPEGSERSGEG